MYYTSALCITMYLVVSVMVEHRLRRQMVYDPKVAKTAQIQLRYYYKIVNCGVFCVIAYNLQSIATHMLVYKPYNF